jgi:hypothetical protein
MKKILATLVLFTYFAVSSGFVVSMHYCMDRFDSMELGQDHEDKCRKCGMHKDGGCCKDEVVMVKLETIHRAPAGIQPFLSLPIVRSVETGFLLTAFENFPRTNQRISHSPPLNEQYTYLENRVFRI